MHPLQLLQQLLWGANLILWSCRLRRWCDFLGRRCRAFLVRALIRFRIFIFRRWRRSHILGRSCCSAIALAEDELLGGTWTGVADHQYVVTRTVQQGGEHFSRGSGAVVTKDSFVASKAFDLHSGGRADVMQNLREIGIFRLNGEQSIAQFDLRTMSRKLQHGVGFSRLRRGNVSRSGRRTCCGRWSGGGSRRLDGRLSYCRGTNHIGWHASTLRICAWIHRLSVINRRRVVLGGLRVSLQSGSQNDKYECENWRKTAMLYDPESAGENWNGESGSDRILNKGSHSNGPGCPVNARLQRKRHLCTRLAVVSIRSPILIVAT
jgi:hypothetical protein